VRRCRKDGIGQVEQIARSGGHTVIALVRFFHDPKSPRWEWIVDLKLIPDDVVAINALKGELK
jgi:hypothetical protein